MWRRLKVCSAATGISGADGRTGAGGNITPSWNRSFKSLDAEDGEKARKDNSRVAVTRAVEAHRNPSKRERRSVVMMTLTIPEVGG